MIVLDTHVWLWWMATPEHLSDTARQTIADAQSIGVCTLSAWEVAMLDARGRISLDRDVRIWVRQALAEPRVESLAPSAEVAVAAGQLDAKAFPGDPVDRLIYCTARATGAKLGTRDKAIHTFDPQLAIW